MTRTVCLIAAFMVFKASVPASAADTGVSSAAEPSPLTAAPAVALPARGRILPLLYASYAALQGYDGFSTVGAMKRGAMETNPAMVGVARHPGAVWAVKVGVTAAAISSSERLWRSGRRTQAIIVMVASNGFMAAVAARNASVLRTLK